VLNAKPTKGGKVKETENGLGFSHSQVQTANGGQNGTKHSFVSNGITNILHHFITFT